MFTPLTHSLAHSGAPLSLSLSLTHTQIKREKHQQVSFSFREWKIYQFLSFSLSINHKKQYFIQQMQNNNPTLQIKTTTAIHTAISYGKCIQLFTVFNTLYTINDRVVWLPLSSWPGGLVTPQYYNKWLGGLVTPQFLTGWSGYPSVL